MERTNTVQSHVKKDHKPETKPAVHEHKHEEKKEDHDHAHDHSHPHDHTHDHKTEAKKEEPKVVPKVSKKEFAITHGLSLHASKKHCMYISSFIKGKTIDAAIHDLKQVIKMKRAVPFKGEIPHRKGKGMMSGRYPVNASKLFITLLKGLKGNVLVNGMDLDKTKIVISNPSWASRPQRRGGVRGKRTNVLIKAQEMKS
ncbi:hypothetical protein KW805_03330 [Candidatus Pacearchaeota archaeon]|nr:hypothetical protein [Candidatus Pacearchaeota archaeon]